MDAATRRWCRALGNYSVTLTEARGASSAEHFERTDPFKAPRSLNPNFTLNDRRARYGAAPRLVETDPVTRERAFAAADAAQLPHVRKALLRRFRA